MAKGTGVKFDTKAIEKGLNSMESKFDLAMQAFLDNAGEKLVSYGKENAKWVNRTGAARDRLNSYSGKVNKGYKLYFAHGVDYGIWLELANEKKYAIVYKTIQVVGNKKIMPAFKNFMDKLK